MRSESKKLSSREQLTKQEIAKTFVLHENNELCGPNLPFYYCRINANKILDGLFVGNQDAAHDLEFLMSIKCKYVINCAGSSVPNLFSRFGVRYLTFRWFDSKTCNIFDSQGKSCKSIHRFIDNALSRGNAVLVHSIYGDSRACLAIAAYLMIKFNWTVKKCLEFVAYKRPETNPKPHFIKQLIKAAKFLHITEPANRTIDDRWCKPSYDTSEEAVVTNTFLNSHTIRYDIDNNKDNLEDPRSPITKLIENTNASNKKKKLVWSSQLIDVCNDNINSSSASLLPSQKRKNKPLTSILKVRPSTPTVLPNNAKHQTSSDPSQSSTNDPDNDNNDISKSNKNHNLNIMKIPSKIDTNSNNSVPDIIRLHHDESNNDLHHQHQALNKPTIADLDKANAKTNVSSNDYLDSTLSYLSDQLNSLQMERNQSHKSFSNQPSFTNLTTLKKSSKRSYSRNKLQSPLHSSSAKNKSLSMSSSNNSLWSSSRPRTKRKNSWSSFNEDSNSSTPNLMINTLSSPNNNISSLKVIGRSNDPIKSQTIVSPFSSSSSHFVSHSSRSNNHGNNRFVKSASKKKYSPSGIRKGPARLYSSKPTPRRSPLHRHNASSHGLSSSLMSDLRNSSKSSFPARRLIKTTSEERLSTLKSHHFKSRYGSNHVSSTPKSRTITRPRSAPKGKKLMNKSLTVNTRPRSNSAKPPSRNGARSVKAPTAQFRRVGW